MVDVSKRGPKTHDVINPKEFIKITMDHKSLKSSNNINVIMLTISKFIMITNITNIDFLNTIQIVSIMLLTFLLIMMTINII